MSEILVVEDYPPMASLLTMMLRRQGHRVERELTVAGALRHERPFAHAVLDIDLPDGDGVALAERLRSEKRVGNFVFFTATREAELLSRAAALGPVIDKADGPSRLLAAIRHLDVAWEDSMRSHREGGTWSSLAVRDGFDSASAEPRDEPLAPSESGVIPRVGSPEADPVHPRSAASRSYRTRT